MRSSTFVVLAACALCVCQAANTTTTPSPLVFTSTVTAAPAASVSVQFQSRFALGQLTATRLASLVNVLAALLSVGSSQLSITVLLGTGAVSVVRFSLTSSLSQTSVLTSLSTAAGNTTSDFYTTAQPVAATIQPVISCVTTCSTTGTASSFRNADNTACTCTCANQWSGSQCAVCAYPYTGSNCNQCADGTVGYPTCYVLPNCTQPSVGRFVKTWSATCTTAVQNNRAASACATQQCTCLGGTYNSVTQACVGANTSACIVLKCAGAATQCQYSVDMLALLASGKSCTNETVAYNASAVTQSAWCAFDQCISGTTTTCGTSFVAAACAISVPTSDAERPVLLSLALVTAVALFLIV